MSRAGDRSERFDLSSITRPTIVEVWSPSCVECRAMRPDLAATAKTFADRVDLQQVNAAEATEMARGLGVLGTPTLIGVRDGAEVFRFTGRRTMSELEELFTAVWSEVKIVRSGRQDLQLRVGAGVALVLLGALAGPVWPLVTLGTGAVVLGLTPWIGRRM